MSEVALGLQAALGPLRYGLAAALPAFVYWSQLRMRYWSPESRAYHLLAWQAVGPKVEPLLRMVPSLRRLVAVGQRWFEAPGRQA